MINTVYYKPIIVITHVPGGYKNDNSPKLNINPSRSEEANVRNGYTYKYKNQVCLCQSFCFNRLQLALG